MSSDKTGTDITPDCIEKQCDQTSQNILPGDVAEEVDTAGAASVLKPLLNCEDTCSNNPKEDSVSPLIHSHKDLFTPSQVLGDVTLNHTKQHLDDINQLTKPRLNNSKYKDCLLDKDNTVSLNDDIIAGFDPDMANLKCLDRLVGDIDEDCMETVPLSSQNDLLRADITQPVLIRGTNFAGDTEDEDLNDDSGGRDSCDPRVDFFSACHKAADQAEELVHRVWEAGWRVVHHRTLPKWLKDNDFLIKGHRPPTYSFRECFKSVFRIHTETGNIWTHLLGFVAFVAITLYFLTRPDMEIQLQEKAVFSPFFFGAILCLGFSTLFHTLYCHSEKVGKLFNKLDYCGISLLTMGSFVPWLYYSFYCRLKPKITYLVLIFILGTCSIVVSLWDKFSTPQFRTLRAGVFIALGLSGVIPALHYIITDGFYHAITFASLGWLVLMAVLYIVGAVIYAVRIPERLFPGKFDIWFQSHQIFHVFVVAAAFVHYHGISRIATYRLTNGDCISAD